MDDDNKKLQRSNNNKKLQGSPNNNDGKEDANDAANPDSQAPLCDTCGNGETQEVDIISSRKTRGFFFGPDQNGSQAVPLSS